MVEYIWDKEMCRRYTDGLRPFVKFDHRRIAKIISKRVEKKPNQKVVDIASGPGFLQLELSKYLYNPVLVAQDMHGNMLEIAKEEAVRYGKQIETCECPAEELTIDTGSVDVVVCKQLLHEVKMPEKVLKEICRILKPGGKAFIIDFDADGSKLVARLLQAMLLITRGKFMAESFWKSFSAGLKGEAIAAQLQSLHMKEVEYIKMGANYFTSGRK
ncbi:MAG: class I SAM-dependent methyltransferase [bacterium]